MNNLMIFEGKQVEVFEVNNVIYFNTKHVAECLDIKDINSSTRTFNIKQKKILKNSDVHSMHIRKLNNAGEIFLTESGVYKLIFQSRKQEAERFQDWVTDEVLPDIRKHGSYALEVKLQEKISNTMRAEVSTLINDIVSQKVNEIEKKCSAYYRPACLEKYKIGQYIKKRLDIKKANEEYEIVKDRVLLKLNANKWEDVPVEVLLNSLNLIDESIRIIKLDRPVKQLTIFDM